jgi:hypothetical protein
VFRTHISFVAIWCWNYCWNQSPTHICVCDTKSTERRCINSQDIYSKYTRFESWPDYALFWLRGFMVSISLAWKLSGSTIK